MKLTRSKLIETLRKLNNGETVYQARKIAGVSVRRVYQVKEAFENKGEILEIGNNVGRPLIPFENWEIEIVKKAYSRYRVSADTLQRLIDRDYKKHIGHNRINKILIYLGYAKRRISKILEKRNGRDMREGIL